MGRDVARDHARVGSSTRQESIPRHAGTSQSLKGFVILASGILRWTAGARADFSSHRPPQLERELQPELHHTAASRTDKRIAGRDVGRGAPAAERAVLARVSA